MPEKLKGKTSKINIERKNNLELILYIVEEINKMEITNGHRADMPTH